MRQLTTAITGLCGLLLFSAGTAKANDIVDFLRAMRGHQRPTSPVALAPQGRGDHSLTAVSDHSGHHQHAGGFGGNVGYSGAGLSGRDVYKIQQHQAQYGGPFHDRVGLGYGSNDNHAFRYPSSLSGVRISLQAGNAPVYGGNVPGVAPGQYLPYAPAPDSVPYGVAPAPQYLNVPPVPSYPVHPGVPSQPPSGFPLAHQIGEIVDCRVPLATCVRIEDPQNIAPDAVPIVVAVRDPHLCAHECTCCTERVVYVEVCVPPCPLQKLTVSPCGTRIRMDFGVYEVDIRSADGLIRVDYDD